MEEISSYNRDTVGTAEKPLIPNLIFKALLDAIIEGDNELAELILSEYSLESNQKQKVEWRIEHHSRDIKIN